MKVKQDFLKLNVSPSPVISVIPLMFHKEFI